MLSKKPVMYTEEKPAANPAATFKDSYNTIRCQTWDSIYVHRRTTLLGKLIIHLSTIIIVHKCWCSYRKYLSISPKLCDLQSRKPAITSAYNTKNSSRIALVVIFIRFLKAHFQGHRIQDICFEFLLLATCIPTACCICPFVLNVNWLHLIWYQSVDGLPPAQIACTSSRNVYGVLSIFPLLLFCVDMYGVSIGYTLSVYLQ